MIKYIRGELIAVEEDQILVDVGGVGVGIFMSVQAMSALPQIGNEVRIHTYMNVKEDAIQLYGFLTRDDLKVFKLLIGVSGIGPKGGQAILSVLSPDDLRYAVFSGDAKAIAAAPGIGKKTAEKVILELKDKLKLEDVFEEKEQSAFSESARQVAGSIQNDALEALVALGYGSSESLKAIKKVEMTEDMTAEQLIKLALKNIMF